MKRFIRKSEGQKENTKDNVELLLKRHRRKKLTRILIIAGVIAVIAIISGVVRSHMTFSDYKVKKNIGVDGNSGCNVIEFSGGFIKCSNDGISYISGKKTVWNTAFEMKSPIIDVCGDYVAVSDESSSVIYIFDKSGKIGEVSTSYPIVKLEVAKQGVVAALMEEGTTNYIEVYDKSGSLLVTEKTVLDGNGYPIDFSLSQDGKKMVVSYVCVSGGVVESKVLFYNFSDVGQNEVDRMVGGFNQYTSSVVPTVEFTDNDTAIAVGDNIFTIYNMDEKPTIENELEINNEIQQVFYNKKYVGIVTAVADSVNPYKVTVYNMKGRVVSEFELDTLFDNIMFDGKTVIMYSGNDFRVVAFNGTIKFDYTFATEIVDIVPISGSYRYLLVSADKMEKIKLK